jgi:2-polyprenyl-3-methyl-5-hydroxy-6-metoxy-1,4-benzoquinol methylase
MQVLLKRFETKHQESRMTSQFSPEVALPASSRRQPCDLCDGLDFEVASCVDRRQQPLTTVICRTCGLVSHERVPDDEELARYYEHQYRQDYHGAAAPTAHRVLRAWAGGEWLRRRVQRYVPPGSRICEIGAGLGCTVKSFELAGYAAEGIEPGRRFQQFAHQRLRAHVEHASLFELPARATYDFVLLVHVIEHFSSPRRALTHIRSLLQPGGQLYVECPNLGAPHAAPGKQFHFAHIHNFTPDTLGMLAQSCGFELVARLSVPRHRALRVVLRRVDSNRLEIVPESYRRARESLSRYSPLGYHLRPGYWLDRLHRDARFVSHHILARQRLMRLVRRCERSSAEVAGELVSAN